MSANIVWAVSDGTVVFRGLRIRLEHGQAWDASDPLVRERPNLFVGYPPMICRTGVKGVEAATAAPGEKRQTRRGPAAE